MVISMRMLQAICVICAHDFTKGTCIVCAAPLEESGTVPLEEPYAVFRGFLREAVHSPLRGTVYSSLRLAAHNTPEGAVYGSLRGVVIIPSDPSDGLYGVPLEVLHATSQSP